jgi:hypothetical protein
MKIKPRKQQLIRKPTVTTIKAKLPQRPNLRNVTQKHVTQKQIQNTQKQTQNTQKQTQNLALDNYINHKDSGCLLCNNGNLDSPRLKSLYLRFVKKWHKSNVTQSDFVRRAVPALFRVAPIRDIWALIWMFQKEHPKTFNRDLGAEVECELAHVAEEFRRSLGEDAKALYQSLDESRQVAFRICHHLSHYTNRNKKRPSLEFFLTCKDLAARLGVSDMQACRILASFVEFGLIKVVRKGVFGQRGIATTFEWNSQGPNCFHVNQLPARQKKDARVDN